jgi:hypothetical protein
MNTSDGNPDDFRSDEDTRRAEALASSMIIRAADRGYRSMDQFVTWFVGGTGALVGLILAGGNLMAPMLPSGTLRGVLWRVAVSFLLALLAKFFGSLVCARAGGAEAAALQMKEWKESGADPVFREDFESAFLRCQPSWLRWYQKNRVRTPTALAARTVTYGVIAGTCAIVSCAIVASVWFELAVSI